MTVIIKCVLHNGRIEPLEPIKIGKFKKKHVEGEMFDMILDDGRTNQGHPLFLKFHALRDEYADATGLDNEYAKQELKHLYGVTIPYTEGFKPPTRPGKFVEIYGAIEFQVSTRNYTTEELMRLVDGTECALAEVQS